MIHFRYGYFICAAILLCIEVCIALFVHDEIIRPHIGDLLVVMLIYCFLRSFLNISVRVTAIITLLFSYLIEFLQYLKIVHVLGLERSRFARVIIGTSFSWIDILCYTSGIVIILFIEMTGSRKSFRLTE